MADRSCLQGPRTTLYPHHTLGDQRAMLGPHRTLGVREPCWVPPHSRGQGAMLGPTTLSGPGNWH